jgi:ribose 5-phosphate isomerase A
MRDGKVVRTDANNVIYDLSCGIIDTPSALDQKIRAIPGVIETGLFCGRADLVLVATAASVRELRRTS